MPTVEEVIASFEIAYPELIRMGLKTYSVTSRQTPDVIQSDTLEARVTELHARGDECPTDGVLHVSVPLIFDHRKAPKVFGKYEVSCMTRFWSFDEDEADLVPEEFARGNYENLHWDEEFAPSNFEALVDRCPELIRTKLNLPDMTRAEMLDALAFGNFEAHRRECTRLKAARVSKR